MKKQINVYGIKFFRATQNGKTQIRAKVFELEAKKRKYGYNNGKRPANKIWLCWEIGFASRSYCTIWANSQKHIYYHCERCADDNKLFFQVNYFSIFLDQYYLPRIEETFLVLHEIFKNIYSERKIRGKCFAERVRFYYRENAGTQRYLSSNHYKSITSLKKNKVFSWLRKKEWHYSVRRQFGTTHTNKCLFE